MIESTVGPLVIIAGLLGLAWLVSNSPDTQTPDPAQQQTPALQAD
ncbi:MAG: hypothetical protein AB8B83_05385 [Bdellovibrionales bacterium]